MKIVKGDILFAPETFICHQCNCVSTRSLGVAASLFRVFPWSNVYKDRTKADKLGTIKIRGDGEEERYVVAMFAQFYPGACRYPSSRRDGTKARLEAFQRCLTQLEGLARGDATFAFPFKIGCGLARGDWDVYREILEAFDGIIGHDRVILYRLDEPGRDA